MNDNSPKFMEIGAGSERRVLAVRQQAGTAPGLFWLSGYKSDMKGTKAEALARWAEAQRRACVRFDYSGHGEFERRLHRRHDRPLAGRQPRRIRRLLPRPTNRDRLVDGRLARLAHGPRLESAAPTLPSPASGGGKIK